VGVMTDEIVGSGCSSALLLPPRESREWTNTSYGNIYGRVLVVGHCSESGGERA
jgi:hypothetical protein